MRRAASIVFVLLFACSAAAGADADIVSLYEKASVSGEYVYLSDIAAVQGPHASELKGLALVRAPKSASGLTLSAQSVASKVSEKLAGMPVTMAGAPRVTVSPLVARVSGAELEALFRAAVLERSPFKGRGTIEISDIRAPLHVTVPEKDKGLLQAKFSPGEDFLGLVTATFSAGGSSSDVARVSGRVKVTAPVPVVRNPIPRGAVISEGDIVIQPLDISSSPLIVGDKAECLGKRAKTALQAGKPFLRSNIEQPPLVSRGDIIAIQARSEELVVVDRGVALRDGHLGERIPIRNVGSGKQIVGTIIAHSLAEVTF
ncbi:MAG TPA: flagellar basal body P-ring formation chaperone FlgA [Deltaproteobacteria bacterium]|jgi:flagella basal body P-ring formation protein FlgA|nr:flagellar basal body P-ring formation chaperone FlgA [Deltaproteobacteria bacterium]